ncbi:hypothetical protein GCM10008942_03710 [Rhizomicrobium electricum]|uniref:Helicase HerA central domain-containing protein n=2 Tax=Rhizomicrobium electricum TaxID=480070 RepID=A0ABP3P1W7_9PROT
MGILLTLWVIFLTAKPVERFASIFAALTKAREDKVSAPDVGTIERIDYPNIVRVKLAKGAAWNSGTLYIAGVCDGEVRYTLALFRQIQGAEVIGTGLCIATADPTKTLPVGRVRASHDAELAAQFIEKLSGSPGAELVGFTVENSNIGIIRFEIASDSPLSEGDVVFASIRQQDIFYQIIDAETAEESFDQNPRGTCIIRAAQLGSYSPEKGFVKFPWVPSMNSPLFWAKKCEFLRPHLNPSEFLVGDVPSTNISVVADLNHLVEYHTAVLGVTGTGKTELALDIVREAVSRNTKVFCVDFTGEYKARLADLHPTSPTPTEDQVADLEKKLFEAETGAYGAGQEKRILKEAISSIKGEVEQQISDFLVKEDDRLAILELGEIANTKATLRLTELYLSSIMMWARRHRKARQILIVLEEAHTIIPETHGAGFDFDTQWVVSRIGQIALQGRKIWGWSSDRQPADRACE